MKTFLNSHFPKFFLCSSRLCRVKLSSSPDKEGGWHKDVGDILDTSGDKRKQYYKKIADIVKDEQATGKSTAKTFSKIKEANKDPYIRMAEKGDTLFKFLKVFFKERLNLSEKSAGHEAFLSLAYLTEQGVNVDLIKKGEELKIQDGCLSIGERVGNKPIRQKEAEERTDDETGGTSEESDGESDTGGTSEETETPEEKTKEEVRGFILEYSKNTKEIYLNDVDVAKWLYNKRKELRAKTSGDYTITIESGEKTDLFYGLNFVTKDEFNEVNKLVAYELLLTDGLSIVPYNKFDEYVNTKGADKDRFWASRDVRIIQSTYRDFLKRALGNNISVFKTEVFGENAVGVNDGVLNKIEGVLKNNRWVLEEIFKDDEQKGTDLIGILDQAKESADQDKSSKIDKIIKGINEALDEAKEIKKFKKALEI